MRIMGYFVIKDYMARESFPSTKLDFVSHVEAKPGSVL